MATTKRFAPEVSKGFNEYYQSSGRARNIVRGIGALTLQNLLNSVMGFVFLSTILRMLSPYEFGAFSAVQTTVGVAGGLANLGFGTSLTYYLAADIRSQNEKWGLVKAAFVLPLLTIGGISVTLLVGAEWLSLFFTKTAAWAWLFLLGGLWFVMLSLSNLALAILQGAKEYARLAKLLVLGKVASVVFGILALEWYGSPWVPVVAWVIYYSIIVAQVFSTSHLSFVKYAARPFFKPAIKYTLPLALTLIVGIISSNVDIVAVGGYLNPTSLAVYNVVITITALAPSVLLGPLNFTLLPETSASQGFEGEVSQGIGLAFRFISLTIVPFSLLVAALAPELISLFTGGGIYLNGVGLLQLLSLSGVLLMVQTSLGVVLQGVGRTKRVLVIGALTSASGLLLSMLLVPRFGLTGAAVSRACVMGIGCFTAFVVARDLIPSTKGAFPAIKILIAAALPSLVVLLLTDYVSDTVYDLVPYSATALAVFFVCIKYMRILTDKDRAMLQHFLPKWLGNFASLL